MSKKHHTILLIQFNRNEASRIYRDFETVNDAMDGICGLLAEKVLKQRHMRPDAMVELTCGEIHDYIDSLADLGALVLRPETNTYAPHNKEWIKDRLSRRLIKQRQ